MSRLFIISSVAIAVILARGKYDMTISYVLPSRKYDMAHINLNSPRKQSLSVDIFRLNLLRENDSMSHFSRISFPSPSYVSSSDSAKVNK